MKHSTRVYWLAAGGGGVILVFAVALFLVCGEVDNPTIRRLVRRVSVRSLRQVESGQSVVDCSLRGLDLQKQAELVPTLRFNLRTRWPANDKLPAGISPGRLLTNAMNPGLGVGELHRAGITGRGVSVAIIDFALIPDHPEFSRQLTAYHDMSGKPGSSSMHGPAVASLLVGEHCGTAPEARLYFVATPDPGGDVNDTVQALGWLLATNCSLPAAQKIRVVSISSSPGGERVQPRSKPGGPWQEARRRAEEAGVMVLDFARENAFIGPCEYDPAAPDDISRCKPVLAKDWPEFFKDHLLVPVSPRTIAEEFERGDIGYEYCGTGRQTFRYHGVSWAAPYCAGVLALGWQLRPDLVPSKMRALLFRSAYTLPSGEKIIHPAEFIRLVRLEP